jgi:hypothetical protein
LAGRGKIPNQMSLPGGIPSASHVIGSPSRIFECRKFPPLESNNAYRIAGNAIRLDYSTYVKRFARTTQISGQRFEQGL